MAFRAKFEGNCKYCKGKIRKGDMIGWKRGAGSWHESCAPSHDRAADREYWAGRADGERYLAEKAIYGEELAEQFAAEDEFNRYWKYGEDY